MNTHFTRSLAIALTLAIGIASAPAAFAAAARGNNGPGAPGNNGSTTGGRTVQLFTEAQDNCNSDVKCVGIVPKKPVVQVRCDTSFRHPDGSYYKDCRRELTY